MCRFNIFFPLVSNETAYNFAKVLSIFVRFVVEYVLVFLHLVMVFVHDGATAILQNTQQVIVVKHQIYPSYLHIWINFLA